MATSALFLHAKYKPPPTPEKSIFDPELSLTIQDKQERKLREFQESMSALATPRSEDRSENGKIKRQLLPDPKMRVFVTYQEETMAVDVAEGKKVVDVKQLVKKAFGIRPSQPARGVETVDTILCLNYAGADLADDWVVSEIGIQPGSSMHAFLRDEEQPTLHIICVHNHDTIHVYQKFKPTEILVSEIRSIASRKCGLPVGVFRLVTPKERLELYDLNTLDNYDILVGDTVHLETWDGWSDFINLASRGFTAHALAKLSNDELIAKYQAKVALYIAAHYGHVDLAIALLKQGVRSDEPVGEHPYRQWCSNISRHVDSLKCPIHVAAEAGQFGIVRTFVHNNICSVMAKDGQGLRPLNVSLRSKQKPCASFLLTKQWSRINFDNTSIPLSLYAKMKTWSLRAKEKALIIHGQDKSTLKKKNCTDAPLVGQGIYLDGFSDCLMSSRSKSSQLKDMYRCTREPAYKEFLEDDPEQYFKNILTNRNKINKPPRYSRAGVLKGVLKNTDESQDEFRLPAIQARNSTSRRNSSTNPNDINKEERLPQITRRVGREEIISPTSVFSHKEEREEAPKVKAAKKRDPQPEFLLLQAKSAEATIPLPMQSAETIPKPLFHKGALSDDIALRTMTRYEEYRGMKAKDYAVKCLSIATTFKEKPWLQQVRMALTLTNRSVKKQVKRRKVSNLDSVDEETVAESAENEHYTSERTVPIF